MLVLHDPHEPAMSSRSTPRRRGGCSSASWRRGHLALVRGRCCACTGVEQPQQLLRQPTAARAVSRTRCDGGVFVVAAWWWSYGWCRRRPRQTASCRLGPVPTRLVLIHSVVCTAATTAVIVVVRDVVQRHALTAHTITSSNILSARAPSIIPSQYTQ